MKKLIATLFCLFWIVHFNPYFVKQSAPQFQYETKVKEIVPSGINGMVGLEMDNGRIFLVPSIQILYMEYIGDKE